MKAILLLLSFFVLATTVSAQELETKRDSNGKYGYVDESGIWVIQPQYGWALEFHDDLAAVSLNRKYGFIDRAGKVIIEPKYDFVRSFSEGLAAVKLNGKYGFIDRAGKVVVEFKYDDYHRLSFREGFSVVMLNDKEGLIDKTGKVVVEPKYDFIIIPFDDDLAQVSLNEKWGLIDRSGKLVIKCLYDEQFYFSHDGLAKVKLNDKYGFINRTGRIIIEPKYDYIDTFFSSFREGLIGVVLNGKWGFIDRSGKVVIEPKYDQVGRFSEGLVAVELYEKWGFIDKSGKLVIQFKYYYSGPDGITPTFYNGLALVGTADYNYGFINKYGEWVINPNGSYYDSAGEYERHMYAFDHGLVAVKGGFVDRTGSVVMEHEFDSACTFFDGLSAVTLNEKWGFIDSSGEVVIEPKYDWVEWIYGAFYGGLAKVKLNKKWGLIDKAGNVIIPTKYDGIWNESFFDDGLTQVKLNGKWGLIDIANNAIVPIELTFQPMSSTDTYEAAKEIVAQKKAAGEYDEIYNNLNRLNSFSYYAQRYIKHRITKWQEKGEFEPSREWQQRVNERTTKRKTKELTKEAEKEYIASRSGQFTLSDINFTLGAYDADNEVFLLKGRKVSNLLLPVPLEKARAFKDNWRDYEIKIKYFIDNDQLAIEEVIFTSKDSQQQYEGKPSK